jgi:hypothetical protein
MWISPHRKKTPGPAVENNLSACYEGEAMTNPIEQDNIITLRTVMELLGIETVNRAHSMMRAGAFAPFRKVGQTYLFNKADVLRDYEAFLSMREAKAV